jgi:hypothetical protein
MAKTGKNRENDRCERDAFTVSETEADIKDPPEMDTLSFKKRIVRMDKKHLSFEETYVLAEIIINGCPLLDAVYTYWKASDNGLFSSFDYNHADTLYLELNNAPRARDSDGWPMENSAVLLICMGCYVEDCEPLITQFKETETEVTWSGLYCEYRPITDGCHNFFPVTFHFEKKQYYAALAQLKAIVDEEYPYLIDYMV